MMKPEIIENYIEKVYGYAINHTYSRDEADELSQEILFTAIRELPKLTEITMENANRFQAYSSMMHYRKIFCIIRMSNPAQ